MFLVLGLAALSLFAPEVEACGRRRRSRRGFQGSLFITPPDAPVNAPPTPEPTPPPPPPPFPVGWQPPPPRPPAQTMSRTNCKSHVVFSVIVPADGSATSNVADRSQVQETWEYECEFKVYVEIEVEETDTEQQCACGLTYKRSRPPLDPNYEKGYKTEIKRFNMVTLDVVKNVVVDFFDSFDGMTLNTNTSLMLEQAAGTNSMNYDAVAAGFSGPVKSLKGKFPSSLVKGGNKYSPNNVPAMCFTVVERYQSKYRWPEPPVPLLYTTPNIWVSQCYPFQNFEGPSLKRADDYLNQKYWIKEFLLFPVGEDSGIVTAGLNPKSRYITSFYRDSNCNLETGVVSFDREFTWTLAREETFQLYGAFQWLRKYEERWVIGGVPKSFSSSLQFWRLGYTKVTWRQVFGAAEDMGGKHRRGVVYWALLGLQGDNTLFPFSGVKAELKLCTSLPAAWETCVAPVTDTPGTTCAGRNRYGENAFVYLIPSSGTTFSCEPAFLNCQQEITFLSFQNFGSLARDFSKRKDSILLTGLRSQFCKMYPTHSVFDSLYFSAYKAGSNQIRKRGSDSIGEARNVNNLLRFNHNGQVVAQNEDLAGPEVTEPAINPAAGSANAYGLPDGDHPVALFPETYTVPVTLNPQDSSFDGAVGSIFDGVLAPCLEGSQGCTCRESKNRPACDAPLECNAESKYCQLPACVAGKAGCPCAAGSTCTDKNTKCSSSGFCLYESKCAQGALGCLCTKDDDCTAPNTRCAGPRLLADVSGRVENGVCVSVAPDCVPGTSGCSCNNGQCTSASDECNEVTDVCVSPSCETGSPGCMCEAKRCAAGFECSEDNKCVKRSCAAGNAGCPCAPGDKCNVTGFECKNFLVDGSDKRCVAQGRNCGDQTARCIKFCGVGNIAKCPPCSHQRPICNGVSNIAPSVVLAAVLAAIMMLL